MPINQNSFWPYSQQTQPMQPVAQTQGAYNGIIQVADENEAMDNKSGYQSQGGGTGSSAGYGSYMGYGGQNSSRATKVVDVAMAT